MNPFLVILIGFLFALTLERLFPRKKLPYVEGWETRAIIFNFIQFAVVIIGGYTWETWYTGRSLFNLPWSPFWNGVVAYLITAEVFYVWHFCRHENNFLWNYVHQIHHSIQRVEVVASFYKHPIEIIINSWIITIITCPILGLDAETNAWLTVFTALAEFFYHLNVRVPRWIGYIIQTPSMHLWHHLSNRQFTFNHGDVSIFDILNGTYFNPPDEETDKINTGFTKNRELLVFPMLFGQNVLTECPKKLPPNLGKCLLISALFLLGSLNTIGFVFDSQTTRGLAIASTASPLPFVFTSYNGIETFTTTYELDILLKNGTRGQFMMDHKLYGNLKGPYNRKNVIGAALSHGPFFDNSNMIKIRDQILHWSFCQNHLAKEFGIYEPIEHVTINIKSKTIGNENKLWKLEINC